MIAKFQAFAKSKGVRVSFISGDVHLASVGLLYRCVPTGVGAVSGFWQGMGRAQCTRDVGWPAGQPFTVWHPVCERMCRMVI